MKKLIRIFIITFAGLNFSAHAAAELSVSSYIMQQNAYSGGYFIVKITIEPKSLNSFFQLEQQLPAGMVAEGMNSHGGIFSFKDGKAKYTWLRIPQEKAFDIMYKVKVPFDAIGKYNIEGSYYFIEDEEKVILPMQSRSVDVVEHIASSDTISEKKLLGIINRTAAEMNELSTAEKEDIQFKIQVISSTKKLDKDSLRKVFQIKDKLVEETTNGLYKYTIGKFKSYESARNFKETMDMHKYIPFVVAYKDEIRISVGEAMQILGQKRNYSSSNKK